MAFSREDLKTYEAKKFEPAPDSFDPFNPADAPANPAEPAAPAAEQVASEPVSVKTEADPLASDTSVDGSQVEQPAEATAAPAEEAVSADSDSDTQSAEADGAERSPRRNDARERIEELVSERNALRKYGEYLLETVKQLQAQPAAAKPAAAAPQADKEDPAPTLEQFDFDPAKFAQAQNEWVNKQIQKGIDQAVQKLQTQNEVATIRANFAARSEQFKKSKADFDVVLSNPALPPLHETAAALVLRSVNGPAIAYHLAKNPDLAVRVARMDPEQQRLAVARIEGQVTAAPSAAPAPKPANPQRTVSQAPAPFKPVESGTAISKKPENLMSMDEWVAQDRARKIAEKEARRKMRQAMR